MAENVPIEMQNILLHHAVLSRTMPQEEAQFPEDGLMLMEKMIETIKNLAESIPTKTVELFERLGRVNHDLTEDVVSDEIADLKPGDSFAMFIRQQYSVFMVHVLRDADLDDEQAHHVVVATFPTSLHPRHVYEHDSDLEVITVFFLCQTISNVEPHSIIQILSEHFNFYFCSSTTRRKR